VDEVKRRDAEDEQDLAEYIEAGERPPAYLRPFPGDALYEPWKALMARLDGR